MVVVVLMAGEGSRFAKQASRNSDYQLPKPMIPVMGRPILEWTTRSLPFIRHFNETTGNEEDVLAESKLYFAILQEHEENHGISGMLQRTYGKNINIISFEKITRGNLETGLIVSQSIPEQEELFFLDSDNAYNGSKLLSQIRSDRPTASICCFHPFDDNPKWCFAVLNEKRKVQALLEKDPLALSQGGKPMVGIFYFESVRRFKNIANQVIASGAMTGSEKSKEFYMSQAVQHLVAKNENVYANLVEKVVPLGTPEDVESFILREQEKA